MILNFAQVMPVGGVINFPEVVIPAQPLQPEQIKETVFIAGTAISTVNVAGSVDSPPSP